MSYCETCFEKVTEVDKHGDCKGCSTIMLTEEEKKVLNKFIDEKWIEVPSPFKAYPPSEGI